MARELERLEQENYGYQLYIASQYNIAAPDSKGKESLESSVKSPPMPAEAPAKDSTEEEEQDDDAI